MKQNACYKLYLVTDRHVLKNIELLKAVEEAILGGASIVQLREKELSSLEFYKIAMEIKYVTDKYNVPLIVNDRLDIALAVDADGLHIGQKDIPAHVIRKILGNNKLLGVSAATVEEAKIAESSGADYVGVGAMFKTSTKQDARAVSVDILREIKQSISIPVVAIGGITADNVHLLKPAGIDGVAVVSDILGKINIREAAEKLNRLICS